MSSSTKNQIEILMEQLRKIKVNKDQGLLKDKHIPYLKKLLRNLGDSIIYFDVAQPWIYYYIIHSLVLLGQNINQQDKKLIKQALGYCFDQGFGGGYLQVPHLAPTYAAFLSILQLGPQAYHLIDKNSLYNFFKKCKKGGRFQMHIEGECDLRGSYIVIIITKLLKLNEDILQGVAQTIIQSQTYQGGISNDIGGQAHGGFTFCGVAGLAAMGRLHQLDISRLMLWLTHRQVQFGGFNGRTGKLLDSCYSFWIGSVFNIVNDYFKGDLTVDNNLLYCQRDLRKYILLYCQDQKGGLYDKPGKSRDMYHTCYSLSGLSLTFTKQHKQHPNIHQYYLNVNLVDIDPIYNISTSSLNLARQHFSKL